MLPSRETERSKEAKCEEVDEYETGKENINKKRKRPNNVKNGSRVPSEHDLGELLPSKRLNMDIDEENIADESNKMTDSPGKTNFSTSTNNHLNDRSPLANAKTPGAKKLVIKNFKGLYPSYYYSFRNLYLRKNNGTNLACPLIVSWSGL